MSNAKRLKFAHVRGARIEWINISLGMRTWVRFNHRLAYDIGEGNHLNWRIHADHAHLQYGPLSRALIDLSIHHDDRGDGLNLEVLLFDCRDLLMSEMTNEPTRGSLLTIEERGMYGLFLAELLADEGL